MSTIWKYPLRITDCQEVIIPMPAVILSVQWQHGQLMMWAQVSPAKDEGFRRHKIYIRGTGQPIEDELPLEYVATVQADMGLVWHISRHRSPEFLDRKSES